MKKPKVGRIVTVAGMLALPMVGNAEAPAGTENLQPAIKLVTLDQSGRPVLPPLLADVIEQDPTIWQERREAGNGTCGLAC